MLKRDFRRVVRTLREAIASVGWDKASGRLGITLLVVSAVFFAANFADKAWVSYQVGQAKQQRVEAIGLLSNQIQTLQQDLTYIHSRSYYMQEARKYGYVQPGDIQLELTTQAAPSVGAPDRVAVPTTVQHKASQSLLHRLLQAVVPGL
jgi:hypothetical protein